MNEEKKSPEVRFPGFEDEWEQRKFKDTVKIERGGSPRPIEQFITDDEDGLNWIKIGDAPKYGSYITSCSEKIKPEGRSKTREVIPGDLILSNSMSFGRPYIMGINGCIHDGWLLIRNDQEIYDLKFLCLLLGTEQMLNQYRSLAAGSAVNNLNKDLVGGTTVKFPGLEEQRKIGEFFEIVEEAITLHQRKLDDLKELKSGLLQKMFPQKGEKVPQIRFPGFTGGWEQRKAADLFESYADKGHPELPVLSATQEYGMVYRDETGLEIHHDTSNEAGYKRVLPGQFVIHLRSFQGGFAHSSIEGITSPAYTIFGFKNKDEQDDMFWKYVFSSKAFIKRLETVTYGIRDGRSISYSDFLGLKFRVPSKDEQEKISEFFSKVNQTITLHQRKIDDLNRLKSGLLQKMFP